MKLTKLKLSELKRPVKNVRIHSEKQIAEFRRSLEKFEQIRPIVVDEEYTILCGNGLYSALTSMGKTEADCLVMKGLSANDKKKLMLTDNKIYSLGVDDMEVFEEFLNDLRDDLDIPGYDSELLETLTASDDDIDEIMSGYGIVSEESKAQMQTTANKYEVAEAEYASNAEEVKPYVPADNSASEPEKLAQRFIVCPKCGERIWI